MNGVHPAHAHTHCIGIRSPVPVEVVVVVAHETVRQTTACWMLLNIEIFKRQFRSRLAPIRYYAVSSIGSLVRFFFATVRVINREVIEFRFIFQTWSPQSRYFWRAPWQPSPVPATCTSSTNGHCSGTMCRSITPMPIRTSPKSRYPPESKSVSAYSCSFYFLLTHKNCRIDILIIRLHKMH